MSIALELADRAAPHPKHLWRVLWMGRVSTSACAVCLTFKNGHHLTFHLSSVARSSWPAVPLWSQDLLRVFLGVPCCCDVTDSVVLPRVVGCCLVCCVAVAWTAAFPFYRCTAAARPQLSFTYLMRGVCTGRCSFASFCEIASHRSAHFSGQASTTAAAAAATICASSTP